MVNIDSHYWVANYLDGSSDIEGYKKFHELNFPMIGSFLVIPKEGSDSNYIIQLLKHPDYCLIFRKQQHQRMVSGLKVGTDYLLGLEPDDGTLQLAQVEMGFGEIEPYDIKSPDGFRIRLTRNDEIETACRLDYSESVTNYNGRLINVVTVQIMED